MTAAPIRRRGRPALADSPAAADEALLDRALEAFAMRGFDGSSLREIAREAGVSHGLLNARFGSKLALWTAAVDQGMERLHAAMARHRENLPADAGIEERMRAVCEDFLHTLALQPAIVQLMNVEGARRSERLDYIVGTFFRGRAWPFTELLAQGQAQGIFRQMHVSVPFTMLAHGAGALVVLRPLVEAADKRLRTQPEALSRTIASSAEMIVRGLKA